jgi:hypothetical protein
VRLTAYCFYVYCFPENVKGRNYAEVSGMLRIVAWEVVLMMAGPVRSMCFATEHVG